jgi:hypothetical protein
MAAKKGNKYNQKLTTPELKKMAYDSFCAHLAKGKPKQSWYFEHPDLTICWKTMDNYIKSEPDVFPAVKKSVSMARGLDVWIDKGVDMMTAETKCQPAIYQIIMRNIHGWDRESPEEKLDKEKREGAILEAVFASLDDRYKGKH